MSLPFGYRYLNNMALYFLKSLKQSYIDDYGKDLESCYDKADKVLYEERIFCLDCPDFKTCKGKCWKACPNRAEAMKIIRGKKL